MKSTLGWTPPRITLPKGSYLFKRLSTRDLQGLIEIWMDYQGETAKRVRLSLAELDREDKKSEIGEEFQRVAFSTPDKLFVWTARILIPEDGAPALVPDDLDDGETIPIWFWTEFIEKLLSHEDADRFLAGFFRLAGKDGKLKQALRRYRTGSGESKAEPDGQMTLS